MRANCFEISTFTCPECGNEFPLPRARATRREKGHIKDLWCYNCKKTVKMIERRPNQYYMTMSNHVIASY